jgi:hypothetical protein
VIPLLFTALRNDERVDAVHRRLIDRGDRIRQDLEQTIFAQPNLGMIGVENVPQQRAKTALQCNFASSKTTLNVFGR